MTNGRADPDVECVVPCEGHHETPVPKPREGRRPCSRRSSCHKEERAGGKTRTSRIEEALQCRAGEGSLHQKEKLRSSTLLRSCDVPRAYRARMPARMPALPVACFPGPDRRRRPALRVVANPSRDAGEDAGAPSGRQRLRNRGLGALASCRHCAEGRLTTRVIHPKRSTITDPFFSPPVPRRAHEGATAVRNTG